MILWRGWSRTWLVETSKEGFGRFWYGGLHVLDGCWKDLGRR